MQHKNQQQASNKNDILCHDEAETKAEVGLIWDGVREAALEMAESEPNLRHLLEDIVIKRKSLACSLAGGPRRYSCHCRRWYAGNMIITPKRERKSIS